MVVWLSPRPRLRTWTVRILKAAPLPIGLDVGAHRPEADPLKGCDVARRRTLGRGGNACLRGVVSH